MKFLGDYATGAVIDDKFVSVDSSGVPAALTGGAVKIYSGNSTAGTTVGVSLTTAFDGLTGLNHWRVLTTADTTFYTAGNSYQAVLSAGAIGTSTVAGYVLAAFSLAARSERADVVRWNGTTVMTPNTGGVPRVDLDLIEGANVSTSAPQLGVNVVNWAGVAVSNGAVSAKPVVDAQAISDSSVAANVVEANIGNLDAAVTSRSTLTAAEVWTASTRNLTGTVQTLDALQTNILGSGGTARNLTQLSGPTFSTATDSLEALRDRGDAAWITAVGFSTLTAAEVWAASTRNLTGTVQTLDALQANVLGSGGTARNLTQLSGPTYSTATDSLEALRDRGDAAWLTAAGFSTHTVAEIWSAATRALTDKSGFALSTAGVAAIHDEVVEGALTARQIQRISLAALAGQTTGGGTTTLRFFGQTTTITRISAGVDTAGNRSTVTLVGT